MMMAMHEIVKRKFRAPEHRETSNLCLEKARLGTASEGKKSQAMIQTKPRAQ